MSVHRKRAPRYLIAIIFVLLLISTPTLAAPIHEGHSPLPTPVPPEPYPDSSVYPAVVYLGSQQDLQALYRKNIDIEGLQPVSNIRNGDSHGFSPSLATVYINPSQANALSQVGLSPIPIPNEGYRSFLAYGPGSGSPQAWPTFEEYTARMQALAAAHPNIVALVSIGLSVQGRDLWCMEVSDNPGMDEYEPEFKYSANHHGDETTGIEMTMRLAEYLAENFGSDPVITDMVDKMEIWLCPIYNPDGYVAGTRYNHNGIDLNRNYPDRFTGNPPNPQRETIAFMSFEGNHRFVMGANYHGGAQVLNYPWDAVAKPDDPVIPAYAPDDQLFYDLGIGYTSRNIDLWNGDFPHGLTRGWQWYQIWGGMQDWDYYYNGEHHVTLEISNTKSPPFAQMDTYWSHNRDAMLWWLQQAWTGLSGQVLDARDSTPLEATVTLIGRDVPNTILTDPGAGDYHRVISAGSYTLDASSDGYLSQSANVIVYSATLTSQDFFLCPANRWTVSGTVTDAIGGQPLQAMIEFIGSRQVTSSNPVNGEYSISICPTSYTMRVSAMWYYPEEREVTIDHDQTQTFSLYPTPNLSMSNKESSATQALPGDVVHYQLHAINIGATTQVAITDTLPTGVTWTGELSATRGTAIYDSGRFLWQGEISHTEPVTISYAVSLNPCLPAGATLLNIAEFADGVNANITGKSQLELLNASPTPPGTPIPIDGAVMQPITTTLSWAASSDLNCDLLTYDIAFGTSPTPAVVASGLTNPSYDPGSLLPGTYYYWQVSAHDGTTVAIGPMWSFSTARQNIRIYLPLTYR